MTNDNSQMNPRTTYDTILYVLQHDYNDLEKLQKFAAATLLAFRALQLHYNDRCNDDNYRDDPVYNQSCNILRETDNDQLHDELSNFVMTAYESDSRSIYVK